MYRNGWKDLVYKPVMEPALFDAVQKVLAQVNTVILGKKEETREIMAAFLANGHVLLEDIPGVGKTTLAVALSRAMGLEYRRVQFTPDVLPSDLTGFSVYRREEERFVYQPGSVFCNLLLADELNRTSPKTQSALLEVMEERKVTVDGETRPVPEPFLVIATQNPYGNAGTSRLPEVQTDRFMISMSLGYPDYESEFLMAKGIGPEEKYKKIQPVLTREELLRIQREIYQVYMKDTVYDYILRLVRKTREHPDLERGASPRATIALVKMAKAWAWMNQRNYVIPSDVNCQFCYVAGHRIILSGRAEMAGKDRKNVLKEIIRSVEIPPVGEDRR